MVDRDRTRPTTSEHRPRPRDAGDATGARDRTAPGEAPGGAVVGEIGRVRGDSGTSDPAGESDLDPNADAEAMAARVLDEVERNDEAD